MAYMTPMLAFGGVRLSAARKPDTHDMPQLERETLRSRRLCGVAAPATLRSRALCGVRDSLEAQTLRSRTLWPTHPRKSGGLRVRQRVVGPCHHAAECSACGGWLAEMGTRCGAEDFGDLLARSCFGFRLPRRLFAGPAYERGVLCAAIGARGSDHAP